IRDRNVTGVQTCALPIFWRDGPRGRPGDDWPAATARAPPGAPLARAALRAPLARWPARQAMSTVRYEPGHLARLLGLPEPTAEQAEVIAAPLEPLAVIAGAGSGKSETMAARLVWLVANGMVRPDRVLGLTFTRKAAAEFADRVRSRLERLRRADTKLPGTNRPRPNQPHPNQQGTADAEDP